MITPSSPSPSLLIGKSSDYTLGYIEAYERESKKKNAQYVSVGWLAYLVIYFTVFAQS
ncbi:MAG: hypothetical protein P9L92_05330 [Candidatus Electryonea clarkiae]|nr:hypothetical protein [Candidatus Electryonea clarkiae]